MMSWNASVSCSCVSMYQGCLLHQLVYQSHVSLHVSGGRLFVLCHLYVTSVPLLCHLTCLWWQSLYVISPRNMALQRACLLYVA